MKKNIYFICCIVISFILISGPAKSENTIEDNDVTTEDTKSYRINENTEYVFRRPKLWDVITNIPATYKTLYKETFAMDNLENIAIITASTVFLYIVDLELLKEFGRWGRDIGIGNEDKTKSMIDVAGFDFFRGPTDIGSAMYFIGDGWTHSTVMASFLGHGLIKNDYRSLSTASGIAHGLITSTMANQFLKRTTGRESPYRATDKRGKWRFFPNQLDYNKDISKYDAFPSGHLQTFTMTMTVISENYPEYEHVTKPLKYVLGSLLAFQMVNNRVHWISDYPLAIGLGYMFGKISASYGKKIAHSNINSEEQVFLLPSFDPYGNMSAGANIVYTF